MFVALGSAEIKPNDWKYSEFYIFLKATNIGVAMQYRAIDVVIFIPSLMIVALNAAEIKPRKPEKKTVMSKFSRLDISRF